MAIFRVAIFMFDHSGYSWLFVAIRGYFHCVAIFLAASGYFFDVSWLFVAIRGYPWLFVAILSKNSRVAIFPRGYFSKVSQMPMLPTLEIAVKIAAHENSRAFKNTTKHGRKNSRARVAILVC